MNKSQLIVMFFSLTKKPNTISRFYTINPVFDTDNAVSNGQHQLSRVVVVSNLQKLIFT